MLQWVPAWLPDAPSHAANFMGQLDQALTRLNESSRKLALILVVCDDDRVDPV